MSELQLVQPGLAFAAGMLTVAAPCVLPLLPVVLGAAAAPVAQLAPTQGTAAMPRAHGPGLRPVFIALGFALSFTALALAFGSVQHLLGLSQQTVRDVASLMLVALGLSMVWPQGFQRLLMALSGRLGGPLNRLAQLGERAGPGWMGGLLVGASLGAVWTPCAGPVLGSVLALVAAQTHWAASASLLGLYALGAALPMMAIAYGGQWAMARLRRFAHTAHRLQQVLGLGVAAVGLLTLLQLDTLVTLWVSDIFPNVSTGL